MIVGRVNSQRDAIIPLTLVDRSGQIYEIEGVIDTGFNGYLSLPLVLLNSIAASFIGRGLATLANGSQELFEVYEVSVIWDGQVLLIEADASESEPLIGMSLLYNYDLQIQVTDGGKVTITSLRE